MPNWCFNSLTVSGPYEDVQTFDAHFKRKHEFYNGGTSNLPLSSKPVSREEFQKLFEKFEDYTVSQTSTGLEIHHIDSTTEEEGYSLINFVPIKKEDFLKGFYNWCVNNWGTKWDVSEVSAEVDGAPSAGGQASYTFDTAWAPPEPVIAEMSRQYPNLTFHHTFEESGVQLAGIVEYEHGVEVDRRQPGEGESDYLAFLRDEFDEEGILECPHCKNLYREDDVDLNDDGEDICIHCEAPLSNPVTA